MATLAASAVGLFAAPAHATYNRLSPELGCVYSTGAGYAAVFGYDTTTVDR